MLVVVVEQEPENEVTMQEIMAGIKIEDRPENGRAVATHIIHKLKELEGGEPGDESDDLLAPVAPAEPPKPDLPK